MKKYRILFISALTLMMAVSCSESEEGIDQIPGQPQELTGFRVEAPAFEYDHPDSRLHVDVSNSGIDIKWNNSDTLGIMPSEGAQAPFPLMMEGQKPDNVAKFTGGGWALRPSVSYSAYYPYIGDIYLVKNAIPVSYLGQWQNSSTDFSYLAPYIYMAANAVTPTEGMADFKLKHVGCYTLFEVNTPEPTALSSIKFVVDEKVLVHEGKLDMSNPNVALIPTVKSDTMLFRLDGVQTTADNLKATLCFMFAPTDLAGKTVKAVLRDADGYEEDLEFAGKNMVAGKAYKYGDLSYVVHTQHPQPNWQFDELHNQFQAGMTSVVTVPKSMQKFVGEGDEMAAYIGGQLRGVGHLIKGSFYVMVHGNIGEVGKVTYKYYNKKKQYIYEATDVVDFNSEKVFGVTDAPAELPLQLVK